MFSGSDMNSSARIIIIKTEPRIDVLRATSILKPLKNRFPAAEISWITSRRNRVLLKDNPVIDRLFFIEDGQTVAVALSNSYSLALNLDSGFSPASLMHLIEADEKHGFTADKNGKITLMDETAAPLWKYEDSPLKFADVCGITYQAAVMRACGIEAAEVGEMIFNIPEECLLFARDFAAEYRIDPESRPVVSICFGVNPHLPLKYYPARQASFLAEALYEDYGAAVIMLSGPREQELLERAILQSPPGVINGGWEVSLARFGALLNLSRLVIAPDCLGLQIALALGKNVLVLLGASPQSQFELYGRGEVLTSPLECAPCGGEIECPDGAECLRAIPPDEIFQAAKSLIASGQTAR